MQIKSQVERRVSGQLWNRSLNLINIDVQDQAESQIRLHVNRIVYSRVEWSLINPIGAQLQAVIEEFNAD